MNEHDISCQFPVVMAACGCQQLCSLILHCFPMLIKMLLQ